MAANFNTFSKFFLALDAAKPAARWRAVMQHSIVLRNSRFHASAPFRSLQASNPAMHALQEDMWGQ